MTQQTIQKEKELCIERLQTCLRVATDNIEQDDFEAVILALFSALHENYNVLALCTAHGLQTKVGLDLTSLKVELVTDK